MSLAFWNARHATGDYVFGTGGPSNPASMHVEADLRRWFGDGRTEHLAEHESVISEGAHHHGMSALIDLVAVKPG